MGVNNPPALIESGITYYIFYYIRARKYHFHNTLLVLWLHSLSAVRNCKSNANAFPNATARSSLLVQYSLHATSYAMMARKQ
jgi:hypothetical protein